MTEIKLSEVKKLLLEGLQPLADKYDYKINKSKFALIKKEKERTSMLYFTENHWYDEVQIMPSVEVSVHQIDELIKKFYEYHTRTYWMNLNKLSYWYEGKSLENFEYYDKDKYIIKNYTFDIENAIKQITYDFEHFGLRYINEFGDINGVDRLLNSDYDVIDLNKELLHSGGMFEVGLVAAKLSNNTKYEDIKKTYQSYTNELQAKDEIGETYYDLFYQLIDNDKTLDP